MKAPTGEGGFSLMELILVILILSISLLPLISQVVQTTVHGADGQALTTATFLAREKLELVETESGSAAVDYAGIRNSRYPDENAIPDFPGFSRTVRVSADSLYGGRTYKVVTVTVGAPDGQSVALTTWVVQ